tara:strand:+ start:588 stop:1175 length:588 start_codon:yes stop_codon:yes gene_type:complete
MATTTGLFISTKRLKDQTPLTGSVDDKLLVPMIKLAQDKHILTALGTDLYDELLNLIILNYTMTADQLTLIQEYIQPCLVQYSFAESLPTLRVRFVNHATTIMSSEQSTAASYEDLKPIMNAAINNAQFYRQRLVDYLCENSTLFPKYLTNTGADLSPETRNYYTGLNVDNANVGRNLQLISLAAALGVRGTGLC